MSHPECKACFVSHHSQGKPRTPPRWPCSGEFPRPSGVGELQGWRTARMAYKKPVIPVGELQGWLIRRGFAFLACHSCRRTTGMAYKKGFPLFSPVIELQGWFIRRGFRPSRLSLSFLVPCHSRHSCRGTTRMAYKKGIRLSRLSFLSENYKDGL